jgi:hypothetical protein
MNDHRPKYTPMLSLRAFVVPPFSVIKVAKDFRRRAREGSRWFWLSLASQVVAHLKLGRYPSPDDEFKISCPLAELTLG